MSVTFAVYEKGRLLEGGLDMERLSTEEVGIFESLRTYGDTIFRLEEHLTRLDESARTAGYPVPVDRTAVRTGLLSALAAYRREAPGEGDFFLRVTLWQERVIVMVGRRPHSREIFQHGVALRTTAVRRPPSRSWPSEAKTTAYHGAMMATLDPKPETIYESVFLDSEGFVAEVRIGNLFIVKNGGLLTPPLRAILNGVTRRFVIECASALGISVTEIPLRRHEVFNADEAFLTNTSWEILPVRELDARSIGKEIPGPVTIRLKETFSTRARQECP